MGININMRCIEMDVSRTLCCNYRININMRCIEIKMVGDIDYTILRININMRCIEMINPVVRVTFEDD